MLNIELQPFADRPPARDLRDNHLTIPCRSRPTAMTNPAGLLGERAGHLGCPLALWRSPRGMSPD